MRTWSRVIHYVLIFHTVALLFMSTQPAYSKDWHYKYERDQSHIARSIECTKGHIRFLLEIDMGSRRHQVYFIIDALLKGILWDLPPAVLRDLKLLRD